MAHAHPPHDDHHVAVADGDDLPAHGPVLEEPRSPFWLPYLGAALLGAGLIWWLSTPNAEEERRAAAAASASASASASAEAAPPPQPTAVPAPPQPAPQPRPAMTIAPTVSINPGFKKK